MVVVRLPGGKVEGSEPVRVANDNWKLLGCPDSGPTLAVTDHRVFVSWMTEGTASQPGVQLMTFDRSLKPAGVKTTISDRVLDSNHPAFSISQSGTVRLVFQGRSPDAKDEWAKTTPYVTTIDRHGGVSPPILVPVANGSAAYPSIAAGESGRTFVVWTENSGEKQTSYFSRGRLPLK